MKTQIKKAIELLESEGYIIADKTIGNKWLDVPELKIKVEIEVHDKGKSWNDLNLSSREDELLTVEECIFLANHEKYSKILKMDGSSSQDDFFIKQPFKLNNKNNSVARFGAGSDRAVLYCNGDPDDRGSHLGVRFVVRKKSKKEKK